jgi:hypothetical protein
MSGCWRPDAGMRPAACNAGVVAQRPETQSSKVLKEGGRQKGMSMKGDE